MSIMSNHISFYYETYSLLEHAFIFNSSQTLISRPNIFGRVNRSGRAFNNHFPLHGCNEFMVGDKATPLDLAVQTRGAKRRA